MLQHQWFYFIHCLSVKEKKKQHPNKLLIVQNEFMARVHLDPFFRYIIGLMDKATIAVSAFSDPRTLVSGR